MNMLSPVSKKTKKIALSVGAAVIAIAVPALAGTPVYHNQGYISGFDGGQVNKDADCNVMQSDPNNAATHYPVGDANSIYVNTNFTGGYSHRYHAMVRKTNAYTQEGDEGYYSWA